MSTLNVDALVGNTSANAITVRGEGSATTSLQQGLNKFWANVVADGTSVSDSFNQGSFTDSGTGIGVCNYTTNMANANYVSTLGGNLIDYDAGNSVRLSQTTVQATGSCNYVFSIMLISKTNKNVTVHGDLA